MMADRTGDPFIDRLIQVGLIARAPTRIVDRTLPTAEPGSTAGRRYALAALQKESDRVSHAMPNTRNDTLSDAAGRIGMLVGAGHLGTDEAVNALTAAAQVSGLPDAEIDNTVTRRVHNGAQTPRTVHLRPVEEIRPAYMLEPITDLTAKQQSEAADLIEQQFPRIDWQSLWDDETEEEWICEPLLAVGRAVVLYSPPKVGKSLLMLEVAAGIATGGHVLGQQVTRRRVLYVDFENDPRGDIRSRLQAMGYDWTDLDDLVVLSYPTMSALDSEAGGVELMAVTMRYQAQVIVIDTLSRAVAGEENSNDTYLAFYRHTVLKCKQAGVAMIRLDHSGKDADRGMRGASAKESDVDAVWRLSKIDEIQLSLECTHHRMQVADTDLLLIRESLPHLHHALDTSGRKAAFEVKVQEALAALESVKLPPDGGKRKARQLLRTTGVSASNAVLEEALRVRKGSIWDQQEGLK